MANQTDAEIDAGIDAWFDRYGGEPEPEAILADLVEFDFPKRLLLLHLSNGRRLVLPLEDLQGLGEATEEQLENYDLQQGQGIEWPGLGVAYRIEGLVEGSYGNEAWMRELRQQAHGKQRKRQPAA